LTKLNKKCFEIRLNKNYTLVLSKTVERVDGVTLIAELPVTAKATAGGTFTLTLLVVVAVTVAGLLDRRTLLHEDDVDIAVDIDEIVGGGGAKGCDGDWS
jgi:hypothetical protein